MKLSEYAHMPPVAALMTPFPYFAHPDDSVADVRRLMDEHDIRHVPVKEGDRVVGIVSDRDLRFLRVSGLGEKDPRHIAVSAVQIRHPYTTELSAPLDRVLRTMAERRIATAVVVRAGKLAGILTVTDVCDALADFLEQRFGPRDPEEAA